MARCENHGDHGACCESDVNPGLRQSLTEMEFERGIWSAAQSNELDRVRRLLEKGTPVDLEDGAGYTALHYAARNGHLEVCELLLRNGASVNAATRSGRATALHRAASQGRVDVVRALLRNGADANLRDADGSTGLHRAVAAKCFRACELLLPRTEPSLVNNRGLTAEQLAKDVFVEALPLFAS